MTAVVSYAYAVVRDAPALEEALTGLSGVSGAPVHLVRSEGRDGPAAAVSPVPASEFGEDALRSHLEDLDWLEATARAHHRVVEALAERTTVLPLRLVTVYLDDERVRSMLEGRRDAFGSRLDELASRAEWGVKVFVDEPAAQAPAGPPPAGEPSPGRAYLNRRRTQRAARETTYRHAGQAAERIESAARPYAVGRVRHRPQQGGIAPRAGENVTNDAYLVPLRHTEEFRAGVARAADGLTGVRIEITGPWAPYSFVAPDTPEDRDPETPVDRVPDTPEDGGKAP
ncbi:GvpL/GvpF family gas vesicle protein [Streptomyces sp. NPDC087218]|uniref:GvpL/GvpF family gas vesicle protein n=1 Tax=Streptomyces sp. NPDC087218 TaxID=3365769 RepID=UPI0038218D7B